jgi:hypothetical protein
MRIKIEDSNNFIIIIINFLQGYTFLKLTFENLVKWNKENPVDCFEKGKDENHP